MTHPSLQGEKGCRDHRGGWQRSLPLSLVGLLLAGLPAYAQTDPAVVVPRDAPSIAAALAALPGRGTVYVTADAKTDPGFTAMDFNGLMIAVSPAVSITGTAAFSRCSNVSFHCAEIMQNLSIDKCTAIRVGPWWQYNSPLTIKQAAYVKDSTDVTLRGLRFRKGSSGIRIDGCFDKPAEFLDKWRRSKTEASVISLTTPGVRVLESEFTDLIPLTGETAPRGIGGRASFVEVSNCKFGPYPGYGIELFDGSFGAINQSAFDTLTWLAIYLPDAEGYVHSSSINMIGPTYGTGIEVSLNPPAKAGPPRYVSIGKDEVANGVSIAKCANCAVLVSGGTGDVDVDIADCYGGIAAVGGFPGRLFGRIDNCDYGIWALENFTGDIVGVVRGSRNTGVVIADTKGPVTLGPRVTISMGSFFITDAKETALYITDAQNITACPEIINKFEGPLGGGIMVTRSEVDFPKARVNHAKGPAGFQASDSKIKGNISVSEGAGTGFFLWNTTLKGDFSTFRNLGPGFTITNGSEVTLVGQEIVEDAGGGFIVSTGSKLDLTRCIIAGRNAPLQWRGPIDGAAPPELFQYGIQASGDSQVTARNVSLGPWSRAAVKLFNANAQLTECGISISRQDSAGKNTYDGAFDGAYVSGKSKLTFDKGHLQVLGGNGFRVGDGGVVEVRNVKSPPGAAHAGHWLLVEADGDALIQSNDIAAWNKDGVRVAKGGKARILGNSINNGLSGHGIRVDDDGQAKIRTNRFTWIEHKDDFRGTHFPIYAEIGARIEQSDNRAGARDELIGPRR